MDDKMIHVQSWPRPFCSPISTSDTLDTLHSLLVLLLARDGERMARHKTKHNMADIPKSVLDSLFSCAHPQC